MRFSLLFIPSFYFSWNVFILFDGYIFFTDLYKWFGYRPQKSMRFRTSRINRSRLILMQFSFDRKIIVERYRFRVLFDGAAQSEHTSLQRNRPTTVIVACVWKRRTWPRSYWTSLAAVNCRDKQCFDGLLRELAMPCNGGWNRFGLCRNIFNFS